MTGEVVLFGTGTVAEVIHYYLTHDSDYEVVAFTVDKEYRQNECKFDLPVVAFEDVQERYPPDEFDMFVAVAYSEMNKTRESKYKEAKDKGYDLISYVCSESMVWENVEIGDNCFIFENQTVQPFVEIGDNVILWSGNHIGHHSKIHDHCFVSSHVVVSGHVEIEPYCFLGVNSTISDGVTVAEGCLIGANALILNDTEEEQVYLGNEATLHDKSSTEVM
jgi:sugar O-acyltransferase (sialic acid O-acetyltransferase NeuD family)